MKLPEKVRAALGSGEIWRAKEMLQGRIGGDPFSVDLYEQMGWILLRMGDSMEAGKYLFLSGKHDPEYEKPISLFLGRYGRGNWKELASRFPSQERRTPRSNLPVVVIEELRSRGLPDQKPDRPLFKQALIDDGSHTFG